MTKSETMVVHFPITSPFSGFSPIVRESPGRDASTVLLANEYSRLLRRIPDPLEVFPLRCVNLGTEAWPVYHGGGILPSSLSRKTWVLTRCARAESSGKWGKRGVNRLEILLANDYPEDVAKALVDEAKATDEFVDSCPAVGCYISGAQPWLASLNRNEGGESNKNESKMKKRIGGQLETGRMTSPRTACQQLVVEERQEPLLGANQNTRGPPRKRIKEENGSKDRISSTTNEESNVPNSTNFDILSATADATKAIQEQAKSSEARRCCSSRSFMGGSFT
jgi:hypothetical protein